MTTLKDGFWISIGSFYRGQFRIAKINSAFYCKKYSLDLKSSVCYPNNYEGTFLTEYQSNVSFSCSLYNKAGVTYTVDQIGEVFVSGSMKIVTRNADKEVAEPYNLSYSFDGEHVIIIIELIYAISNDLLVRYDHSNEIISLIVDFKKSIGNAGLIFRYEATNYNKKAQKLDDMLNNSDMTFYNALTASALTHNDADKCISFNQANQANSISDKDLMPYLPSKSISIFVYMKPTGKDGSVLNELGQNKANTDWHDAQIQIVGGKFKFGFWKGGLTMISADSVKIDPTKFYYVGYTYNDATKEFYGYVNGQRINVNNNIYTKLYPTTLFYTIGAADSTNMGTNNYGDFCLRSVHVFNYAISEETAKSYYSYTTDLYN